MIKKSESIGKKETSSSESSVQTSAIKEEKNYTPKEVLVISLTVGTVMMMLMYVFLTNTLGTDRDARMDALKSMCFTYAGGGEPVEVYNISNTFTVVCAGGLMIEQQEGFGEWEWEEIEKIRSENNPSQKVYNLSTLCNSTRGNCVKEFGVSNATY